MLRKFSAPLELWGGLECTINRVANTYHDQIVATRHHSRCDGDLELIAGLGVKRLRYPVLWERIAPERAEVCDWSYADEALPRIRDLGISIIAGLVHHGSGPRYADILSDQFAPGLAVHAAAVAQRFPWIEDWTPVNEPVTTARFTALYGHWYPHAADERSFWLALLNQIDATRLAMKAVREVNPAARLIATDDLGTTYGTAATRAQAQYDNNRRWMSWDLLTGRVVPGHPFYIRLSDFGFGARLHAIADDPCPPDVIGVNHYLTSDRFLDHRTHRYPSHLHGGNAAKDRFVDTEAVRVLDPAPADWGHLLLKAWDRFRLPVAITEVHLGCTREEQLRWLREAWDGARRARAAGADVRAVTGWALFGNQGWNTLLRDEGVYEPGAFDVTGPEPRPTAVARMLRAIGTGESFRHPVIEGAGWWQRSECRPFKAQPIPAPVAWHAAKRAHARRPLLITGATGTLGRAFAGACRLRDLAHVLTDRAVLPLDDPARIAHVLDELKPWAVINAAGWVRVDDAEGEADACLAANRDGALALAEAAAARDIPTLSFSSDLVFDGRKDGAYVEHDRPSPLGVYGLSKAGLEAALSGVPGEHLLIRTAAFFSPDDRYNFAVAVADTLRRGERFLASGTVVTPTYTPDLVRASLDLLIDGEAGVWHLTNEEALSWAEFARRIASALGLDPALIDESADPLPGWRALRPEQAALVSARGKLMPPLADAIRRFAEDYTPQRMREAA